MIRGRFCRTCNFLQKCILLIQVYLVSSTGIQTHLRMAYVSLSKRRENDPSKGHKHIKRTEIREKEI